MAINSELNADRLADLIIQIANNPDSSAIRQEHIDILISLLGESGDETEEIMAISDETTALSDTTDAIRRPMAFDGRIKEVFATLNSAPTAELILDINLGGTTIFGSGNKLTIDLSETTSLTASSQPQIDETANTFSKGDILSVDIDDAGTSGATGCKVVLILEKT